MARITLKGNPVNTLGEIPQKGTKALNFKLVKNDLSDATLENYTGKRKILNIFPSLDTATCAMSVRKFNVDANILLGWIDRLQTVSIGTLVIELTGPSQGISDALNYFSEKTVHYEVIENGP